MSAPLSPPLVCTYRLQLHAGFDFAAAAELVPYFAELGISHIYASPYLQAAKGSTHGYDVVDPTRVNAELGGEPGRTALVAQLAAHGLGQILDIVPNHMAITASNPWWWDVLENGPSSRYASAFDVDWDPPEARLRNTLLIPVLGDHYGVVLEAGEIRLERQGGAFQIRYFDNVYPVAPRSLDTLVERAATRLDGAAGDALAFFGEALRGLPLATAVDQPSVYRRHRNKEVIRNELERLLADSPLVAAALDAEVEAVNGDPDTLDQLLERQNYRLAYWRAAGRDLGYRRFFDINTLVGLRMEDPAVFALTHARILTWLKDGSLAGVRIDHPDGLRDPAAYVRRLRTAAPDAWIVVEKILETGEALRSDWQIDGTTGYEFLNHLGGLFVDAAAKEPLTRLYAELTGEARPFADLVREKKHLVLRDLLGSDLNRLTALFVEICEHRRRQRDYTRHELHEALAEYVACLGIYRTYVTPGRPAAEEDSEAIKAATASAKRYRPDLDPRLFDALSNLLLGEETGKLETELVQRLQQFTGSVMAKGVEDTLFYGYTRFAVLNEVGGDPDRFGTSVEAFHAQAEAAQRARPRAMLATSTHDTKRSEDVRARLYLLSEEPIRWAETVQRWHEMNARHRTSGFPDPAAELLYYQTLVGAWPLTPERAKAYMQKAGREAKVHTSWLSVQESYEQAVAKFVDATLGDEAFCREVERFVTPLIAKGRINSLAQTLIKMTYPGIPDIYRGTELWDLSLVDPDNRRPVDFAKCRRLLPELAGATPEQVLGASDSGLPKLFVLARALAVRSRHLDAFGDQGAYQPLALHGAKANHGLAYLRGDTVATVVPRLVLGLGGDWRDTSLDLPPGTWVNELTGESWAGGACPLAKLLGRFPVALLTRQARDGRGKDEIRE